MDKYRVDYVVLELVDEDEARRIERQQAAHMKQTKKQPKPKTSIMSMIDV